MSRGAAISTVTVAGQNEITTTGEVRIGPGRGKLQLAIESSEPVVVRFAGEVARLSDVVMINRSGAGVVGIPGSKVHFSIGRRCSVPVDPTVSLGKTPARSEQISDLYKAWTDGRHFRHQDIHGEYGHAKTRLAEEMDWMYPGGVVEIEPSKVASPAAVVRYATLPALAGALQLEESGALVEATPAEMAAWTAKAKIHHGVRLIDQVKIGTDGPFYRVTRPIQVPAGLCGALSVNFLVPSADYLKGDPCHAEILQEDGHILAPSWYIVDPDCGLAAFDAAARPHAPGPLKLRTIHCLISQPVRGDSVPMVSPDARYMTLFPNSDKRLPLQVWDIASITPLRDYAFTSSRYGNLTLWQWPGSPPTYHWNADSTGIWAAKPVSDADAGRSPLRPAFIGLDGTITTLPDVRHPPGLMDGLQWVGARGHAIASFRNPEVTDKATHEVLPISYGMIDAVHGVVLDDFQNDEFQGLRQSNPDLKKFFYADRVVGAELANGKPRVLMDLGRWVLWTQSENPRVVPDLPRASGAALSADGKTVLMLRPDLPGQENSEIRVFCEDSGDGDDSPCFVPHRREGSWASFHDVETGRLLWSMPWRFDRHDMLQNFALSPDGRFALFTLPARTDPNKMLVAMVSMSDGRIVQTLPRPYGNFSMGFASAGKVAWVLTGKATILYDVD